jgi:hypothetical protein
MNRTGQTTVKRHLSPIDLRPFQARAALDRQEALEARYGELGIDEVVAAVRQLKAAKERDLLLTRKAAA